jgi:HK97 family phage prohead protease
MGKNKNLNGEILQRSFCFDVRAERTEEGGNIITGRPIVYDSRTNIGYFDEVIRKGALDNADLRDVRFLVNHDLKKIPLARSRNNNGNSTMHLTIDDQGLAIRVTLDTENNMEARALYSAVQRGDISGMSFMFRIDGEEWEGLESDHPTRYINAISTVYEVSAVTFPAYDATEINARDESALDGARKALESARELRGTSLDSDLALAKAKTELMSLI